MAAATVPAAINRNPDPISQLSFFDIPGAMALIEICRTAKRAGLDVKGTTLVYFDIIGINFNMPTSRLCDCEATSAEELVDFLITENAIAKVSQ